MFFFFFFFLVGGGGAPPECHTEPPPPENPSLCVVHNTLTSANHLGYIKEAVGRNLSIAARQPELDKVKISKSS
jgi:hypothetical protein